MVHHKQKSNAIGTTTRVLRCSIAVMMSINILQVCVRSMPKAEAFQSVMLRRSFVSFNNYHRHRLLAPSTIVRFVSSEPTNEENKKLSVKKKKSPPKSKNDIKFNDDLSNDQIAANLAAAFDELARKEGFDPKLAKYADNETFEDDFDEDELLLLGDDDDEDDGYEFDDDEDDDEKENYIDTKLDPSEFDISDFIEQDDVDMDSNKEDDEDEDDDEYIDFGNDDNDEDDMDARIAAAKRGMVRGQIPKDLATASVSVAERLGFRTEENPFGNDETPRKKQYTLITNAMTCSACGTDFQSRDDRIPGYLPKEKFETQKKLAQIEEMQRLKKKAESFEWSSEEEIEYLIQTGGQTEHPDDASLIDIDAKAEELGLDLVKLSAKKTICKRCHNLQNYGVVDASLRPGWTEEPTLAQEKFRNLLRPIGEKPAVIIALVDLFDFSGSVLRELDSIAGENPVILAANKVDLLPSKMGHLRAENWVRRELEYLGVQSIANVGGAVRLVSCKTGVGVSSMLDKARKLAEDLDGDVYVVGAANAGKSTLINYLLGRDDPDKKVKKIRAGNKNALQGALTTSPLPGTTLKFIKIDLGDGKSLYDTPGLLVPGALTQLLTPEELKIVVPKKQVEPITFRVASGKCVLVGGLAKIEVIDDSRPFLFTFFVANDVKLHCTDASKADDFVAKHAGGILTPPLQPGLERMKQIGEFTSHVLQIKGEGWKEAAADITLAGLGWVAVTGAGPATVRVTVPKGVGVSLRPPLMPFDIWDVAARYTGGKAVRKITKTKSGKRNKGVGRN